MRKLFLIPLLALFMSLNACTTTGWLVGGLVGAGAAAYYVKNDERTAGQIADDFGISTAITASFVENKEIKALNIRVNTYQGTVTLYGKVPNAATEKKAMLMAADVKGVKKVISKLKIEK